MTTSLYKLGAVEIIINWLFYTPAARTDIYKGSFFPQTIKNWNALPDSIIPPLNVQGPEDGAARFTSLIRARD